MEGKYCLFKFGVEPFLALRQKVTLYGAKGGFVSISNFEYKDLAAVFATHLARTLGMFFEILNQTHVTNSHHVFGQLF